MTVRRSLAQALLWGILTGPAPLLSAAPTSPAAPATLVEGVACLGDPSQTYTLYLPSGYRDAARHPALLIFDPRGRSRLAAELFRAAAERHGWVLLAADGTRSDGPMEPNERALRALWPEVHRRYATDPRRIYAAGFSGGGMLAWALARATGEVAGVIAAGARFEAPERAVPFRVATFGAAGDTDFNLLEMRDAHRLLAAWGASERLEVFPGGHAWFPADLAALAVDWLELAAMREGLRPAEPALVAELWEAETARAEADEAAARPLAAARRWAQMSRDFAGLRPVDGAAGRAARLSAAPAARAAERAETRAEREERAWIGRFAAANARLLAAEEPPMLARYLAEVELAELQRRAHREDPEGGTARRQLATLEAYTTSYLLRDALARGLPGTAAVLLEAALRVSPERPDLWYALARARARAGSRDGALAALDAALARGFDDPGEIAREPDFAPLGGDPRFAALLARGSPRGPTPSPAPTPAGPPARSQEEPCPPPAEN